ncbi:DEAD/DEAH box helicase [Roseivivax isoporae]|uniref:DEAD/DEAH box helicase n=1 Tax=Roseivivax isoporae LMG 25204 TaxID=1449351 RepID=X7FD80_9RHOB|nr:DEAD/DEAH box helicase [Roseivivax isoporae]ETX30016.1 DEAD/DEAH box helicase [Roseivivax isoporae LMG 25204]
MIQTLSDALAERGYDTLTPVQEAVTAPHLAEADLLVSAQTGSGKTVGFGLAIGPTILDEDGSLGPAAAPLALVVAPTRELAFQVTRELGWLYAAAGARVVSCVGGMDMRDERRALERGAHIVVGTPGRLRDHIQRGSLDLTAIRAVVLDEADEMLDLGFREDLEFMLGEAPAERRTLLFSATVPPAIATLAQHYQRDAVRVTTLSERSQHADIAYQVLKVAPQDAENAIINVLRYHEAQNAIVFANTRATVNRLTARFSNRGFAVVCLSGELSQSERSHALQAMRDGRARVCVATDVAARGIDLPNLELVIHAELPSNAEGLLHRSGRTGRAGRKGISALVVPPKATGRAERLLKSARVTAEWTTAPGADEILRRDEERLLADPTWDETPSETEAAFAARLVAERGPEEIAAAYLRLYRTRHSAPEDLADPDARHAPVERAPFGPSAWIALSVGRDERAEPRWLLPLLCRAGGLEKESIGAIRVQATETYVELTEASLPRFLAALGDGGELEKGVTARRADGPPPQAPRKPASDRPARRPKPEREDAETPRAAAPAPVPAAREDASDARTQGAAPAPRPQKPAPKPRDEAQASRPRKAWGEAKPRGDGPDAKPRKAWGEAKPRGDGPDAKPRKAWGEAKPRGDGPDAKPRKAWSDAKPRGEGAEARPGKPRPAGKPRDTGAPGARPKFAKGAGPARERSEGGAGAKRKPGAPASRASASDTSQRYDPTGRSAKGPRKGPAPRRGDGGSQTPKRPKR